MAAVGLDVVEEDTDEDSVKVEVETFGNETGFEPTLCESRAEISDFRELNWFCIFISRFWKRKVIEASEEVLVEVEDID